MSEVRIRDLNIFYGDFLAVKDVNMDIEPRSITAPYRSFWLRQIHVPAFAQPYARGHPGRTMSKAR